MRAAPGLAPLLVLALALAGCSGDGGDDDGRPTPSPEPTSPSPTSSATATSTSAGSSSTTASPRPAQTIEKDIMDNSFPQGTFTIQKGDTVRWTHRGTGLHSVTSTGGSAEESFDSSPNCPPVCIPAGTTFQHTFTKPGDVTYHCKVHGSMTGTITVVEALPP